MNITIALVGVLRRFAGAHHFLFFDSSVSFFFFFVQDQLTNGKRHAVHY